MNLTDLGVHIEKNQPTEFIDTYLRCMAKGFQLPCPVDTDIAKLIPKWSKVLARYRRDFSDAFCADIATKWFKLIEQCDTAAADLPIQILRVANINMAEEKEEKDAVPKTLNKKTTPVEIPKNTDNPDDPLTTPAISDQYRQRSLAEKVRLPEVEKLKTVYAKAFKSNNVAQFLTSHLSFSKYDQSKTVPRATMPQAIREAWEDIIADEFHTIPDDDFLADLTNEWFYLVNQKGIPMHDQHVEEILMAFLAKKQNPTDTKPKNPTKSLFQRLLGK